jgi:hypothetical protein
MKELHIWLDNNYPEDTLTTYNETAREISIRQSYINTTQIHFCHTRWLEEGYRLFLHTKADCKEVKLGMNDAYWREIKVGHNLEKLLLINDFKIDIDTYI